ncbi:MAG: hypothetical protein ACLT9P_05010 [Evtepia gabavorous]
MDLSKHALRRAAKRQGSIEFAVASVYDLPVADQQIDLLVNCFSPGPGGVSPGAAARRALLLCGSRRPPPVGAQAGAL